MTPPTKRPQGLASGPSPQPVGLFMDMLENKVLQSEARPWDPLGLD